MNPAARVALVAEHWTRAREASDALFRCGFAPVVTGSLAAWVHGCELRPADVDLEVSVQGLWYFAGRALARPITERAHIREAHGELLSRTLAGLGPGPSLDLVVPEPGAECPVAGWVWVEGLPVVDPTFLVVRALARIAAADRG